MRPEDISDSLNYLDDDMLAEAENIRDSAVNKSNDNESDRVGESSMEPPRQKSRKIWMKWGAIAACLCVLFIAGIIIAQTIEINNRDAADDKMIAQDQDIQNQDNSDIEETEPDSSVTEMAYAADGLQILDLDIVYEGAGFEGLMYYTVEELYEMHLSNNPWDSSVTFDTLPVYKDQAHADNGIGIALKEEELNDIAQETASLLGEEIQEITSEEMKADGQQVVYMLTAKTENARIKVDGDGDIRIDYYWYDFDTGEHNTTMMLPNAINWNDAEAAANYWVQQFSALLKGNEYRIVVNSDYSFEGTLTTTYGYHLSSDDPIENLLNYTLTQGNVYQDEQGNLQAITFKNDLTYAEKIGDYPVISVETANELLFDGCYLSSIPYAITEQSIIAGVELVYMSPLRGEYMVPYYRYYVEIPEERQAAQDGLTCYGAYYVPAIEQEYISDKQIYDGQFN